MKEDLAKYTQQLMKYLDQHIENQIQLKFAECKLARADQKFEESANLLRTKMAGFRVKLRRKGIDLEGLDGSIGFDPAKHPTIVKRRLEDNLEHIDEWAKFIKEK